eukprot:5884990-Amphidinium_carterae.1
MLDQVYVQNEKVGLPVVQSITILQLLWQEREYQEQNMRLKQFELYRQDVRDLVNLTTGKMDLDSCALKCSTWWDALHKMCAIFFVHERCGCTATDASPRTPPRQQQKMFQPHCSKHRGASQTQAPYECFLDVEQNPAIS